MKNWDEIALLAQQGDSSALDDLCEGIAPELKKAAQGASHSARTLDVDDLTQEAYLVMLDALNGWKPDAGSFRNYLSMRVNRELKHVLYSDGPVALPEKIGGAVRACFAKEAAGEPVDVPAVAKAWSVGADNLRSALAVNADPDAAFAAMYSPGYGHSPLTGLVGDVQRDGIHAVATDQGVSIRTARRRFEQEVCRQIHPTYTGLAN